LRAGARGEREQRQREVKSAGEFIAHGGVLVCGYKTARYRSVLEKIGRYRVFAWPSFVVFAITPGQTESVDRGGAGYIPWRDEAPALAED
jgi:hypothetical protein